MKMDNVYILRYFFTAEAGRLGKVRWVKVIHSPHSLYFFKMVQRNSRNQSHLLAGANRRRCASGIDREKFY